jgi:multiple antibiotic resistance protein
VDLLSAALVLVIIIDPVGNIPVFHAILGDFPPRRRLAIILRELLFAYGILVAFLLAGESMLAWLGLERATLGISGGIILFLVAIGMVFGQPGLRGTQPGDEDPFIVPLATPLLAGPSAVAVLLLWASTEPGRMGTWLAAVTIAWLVAAAVLLSAGLLMRWLGRRLLRAAEKLMGMLLVMLAVQMFLDGLRAYPAP